MARSDRRSGAPQNLRRIGLLGAAILACAMAAAGVGANATPDFSTEVIPTTSGPVRGVSDGNVNKFLGIRYAAR